MSDAKTRRASYSFSALSKGTMMAIRMLQQQVLDRVRERKAMG